MRKLPVPEYEIIKNDDAIITIAELRYHLCEFAGEKCLECDEDDCDDDIIVIKGKAVWKKTDGVEYQEEKGKELALAKADFKLRNMLMREMEIELDGLCRCKERLESRIAKLNVDIQKTKERMEENGDTIRSFQDNNFSK